MVLKKYWEDEIVFRNFVLKSVEKLPLARSSNWNCKEEIIQIKEERTIYVKETGRLCMKIGIISSNIFRVVVALATSNNGNIMERVHAVILGIMY
jgi:hypothetical protein